MEMGLGFSLRWTEYKATIKCQTKNQEMNCWEARLDITTVYDFQKDRRSEDLSLSPDIEIAAHPSLGNFLGETNVAKN